MARLRIDSDDSGCDCGCLSSGTKSYSLYIQRLALLKNCRLDGTASAERAKWAVRLKRCNQDALPGRKATNLDVTALDVLHGKQELRVLPLCASSLFKAESETIHHWTGRFGTRRQSAQHPTPTDRQLHPWLVSETRSQWSIPSFTRISRDPVMGR